VGAATGLIGEPTQTGDFPPPDPLQSLGLLLGRQPAPPLGNPGPRLRLAAAAVVEAHIPERALQPVESLI
jgi:hypothetical protein